MLFATDRVVIATGGIGGLLLHGTNPAGSFGQGLAFAARAGAVMADLEFIQFHPTALDSGSFPLKLISEAVRGEGAIFVDENGDRFMENAPGAELAPPMSSHVPSGGISRRDIGSFSTQGMCEGWTLRAFPDDHGTLS